MRKRETNFMDALIVLIIANLILKIVEIVWGG